MVVISEIGMLNTLVKHPNISLYELEFALQW